MSRKYKWIINGKVDLVKILATTEVVNECLLWKGCLFSSGYGKICISGKPQRVHRVVYGAFHNEDIELLCVRHTCGSYSCINPMHLVLGNLKRRIKPKSSKSRFYKKRVKGLRRKPYIRKKNVS